MEILYNGEWGTVCDDLFGDADARVVCSQLGLSGGSAVQRFGGGSGTIWLDSVECIGSEPELGVCDHSCWGCHDCSHYEDVGVVCRRCFSSSIANLHCICLEGILFKNK